MEKLFTQIILNGDISKLKAIEEMNILDYFKSLNDGVINENKKNRQNMNRAGTSNTRIRR